MFSLAFLIQMSTFGSGCSASGTGRLLEDGSKVSALGVSMIDGALSRLETLYQQTNV